MTWGKLYMGYVTPMDIQIAWMMFKEWLARTFPLAPGYQAGYFK